MSSSVSHVAHALGPASDLRVGLTAVVDVLFELLVLVASLALANALAT
jgi:hypothetical protein